MTSSGGAWEVVVDKAALEVTKYLAATTDRFLPDSCTARWMLTLLNTDSLRDILVERNYSGNCGMIGCPGGCRPAGRRHDDGECVRHSAAGADGCREDKDDDEDEWAKEAAEAFQRYERYRTQRTQQTAHAKPVKLGATMAHRFCSPACAEEFEALMQKVSSSLVYGRGEVVQAVGRLFPNMSLAALQRLAGAESTSVADIFERRAEQEGSAGPQPPSLQEVLHGIEAEGNTWSRDMRPAQVIGADGGRKRRMPLPLMVYDWCMTMSTARTKDLFATLCHKGNLSSNVWKDSENQARRDRSLYVKCMQPIRSRCVQRAEVELSSLRAEKVGDAEPPSVDPQLQLQRLALFATHVFSAETTATLSRLLLYDEATLKQAWDVWRSSGLLASLQFPFALPGVFVAGGGAPSVLFLALVLLAATGLCEAAVWAEWMWQDADDEAGGNALSELMVALGVTAEDLVACVRVLVLE
ncbi:hypothetical protein TRSC58_01266 [Trypanosoma rangeli SC58]|uniref:RTR1-type domain-containing protein n=1 Tax=Trypanosoma rangeli SC58 TaxID=429131 RepID=A0A061J6E9_TRYRA|nr:hypothetical protein TRSC58_01266 [Trypanosoma rangeli SC58]